MPRDAHHYTATMAKLYAEQGYLRKSAEIYRHLVAQHPQRAELQQALAAVEQQISQQQRPGRKELGLLIREWIDLMQTYNSRRRSDSVVKGGGDDQEYR